jgi:isoamylase
MLSQGTPMLLAGDEFGRTQNGNNNAYCQDNEISWVDWSIDDKGKALIRFVQRLTHLRHEHPMLHYTRFLNGEFNEDLDTRDVSWIRADGQEFSQEDWGNTEQKYFGMLLDVRGYSTEVESGEASPLLILFNALHEDQEFVLPPHTGGESWKLLLDTNRPELEGGETRAVGENYHLVARSMSLFALNLR